MSNELSMRTFLFPSYFIVAVLALASQARAGGRTFIYREANLALQYSFDSATATRSNMPLGNALGLEFVHTRRPGARGSHGLSGLDLHMRLIDPPGPVQPDLYFEDAWALFRVGGRRSQVRVGHFNIPFGMNPVMEPRGIFRMPLEATDLGFKKDWGIAWQRESGRFDVELGGFIGTGGDLHWRRGSYLLAGRVGIPTYRDLEYGVSLLVAEFPPTMGVSRMNAPFARRVRTGLDILYLYGTHTILKAEATAGSDDGRTVVGAMAAADWIPPRSTRWVLAAQAEALRRGRIEMVEHLARLTLEASYSLGDLTMLRLDLVRLLESPRGASTDLYLQVHHYGR